MPVNAVPFPVVPHQQLEQPPARAGAAGPRLRAVPAITPATCAPSHFAGNAVQGGDHLARRSNRAVEQGDATARERKGTAFALLTRDTVDGLACRPRQSRQVFLRNGTTTVPSASAAYGHRSTSLWVNVGRTISACER